MAACLNLFLIQDHMGIKISKISTPHTFFIRSHTNFMRTLATMVEYRLLRVPLLTIGYFFFLNMWLMKFNMGVNGDILNMRYPENELIAEQNR